FRFFLNLCGWAPGQLKEEIDRGIWYAVSASTNIVLKHCIQLPVPLWREVMTLMGPKYGQVSQESLSDLL
ncbi:unnamed protein product, partial [Choristocarpus tenellus]